MTPANTMRRLLFVAILALLGAVGCIDRTRVNARCEWRPEDGDSLRLSDQGLANHLDRDVELAIDLAVRHADRAAQQRTGYEGHGGLVDGGRLRNECMATLLSAIATTHAVPLDRVVAARSAGRRPAGWDAMVILVFSALYGCASLVTARLLSRRFPNDEGWPGVAAPAAASLAISALGIVAFELWAVTLEMVRLGNDHISGYRAHWNPWQEHLAVLYMGGVLLFLSMAALNYYLRRQRPASTAA